MTTLGVIGPGRAGTLVCLAAARAGRRVVAVGGGSERARATLAERIAGVRAVPRPADVARLAHTIVIAVPDDSIEQVVDELVLADALDERHEILHLAGSRGLAELRRAGLAGARTAACHPAMTIPEAADDPTLLVGVAWAVTASPEGREFAHRFVTDLGGDPHDVDESRRPLYHAGLSVASNAVGAAVVTARQLLIASGVRHPHAFLGPLVDASVDNVVGHGARALTGPVARGDVGTVRHHLDAIAEDLPELERAYRLLALVVLDRVRGGLGPDTADALERMLEDGPPGGGVR